MPSWSSGQILAVNFYQMVQKELRLSVSGSYYLPSQFSCSLLVSTTFLPLLHLSMATPIYHPTRLHLLHPTPFSSRYSAISTHLSAWRSFSLARTIRSWAQAPSQLRVRVRTRTRTRTQTCCVAAQSESPGPIHPIRPVRIVTVVGEGSISPLKNTPWEEVMRHTVSKPLSPLKDILL